MQHTIAEDGDLGCLTYFWITGDEAVAFARIFIYMDGELSPSLIYSPAKAAGVGIGLRGFENGTVLPLWSTK